MVNTALDDRRRQILTTSGSPVQAGPDVSFERSACASSRSFAVS